MYQKVLALIRKITYVKKGPTISIKDVLSVVKTQGVAPSPNLQQKYQDNGT